MAGQAESEMTSPKEGTMASPSAGAASATDLPDYAPVPQSATGTLQYEIYFNDDQSECIVLERYRDSEALVEHAGHLGDLGRAIPGLVSSELLGQPSDDVRAKLIGSGVRLFTPFLSL
jgi:quinol monooxygenase YgiN